MDIEVGRFVRLMNREMYPEVAARIRRLVREHIGDFECAHVWTVKARSGNRVSETCSVCHECRIRDLST